jgi:hypothetical protein
MQRIIVDLPLPDGPQMTSRSPLPTERLMFRSTWNSPYHLWTPMSSIIGRSLAAEGTAPATALISVSFPC